MLALRAERRLPNRVRSGPPSNPGPIFAVNIQLSPYRNERTALQEYGDGGSALERVTFLCMGILTIADADIEAPKRELRITSAQFRSRLLRRLESASDRVLLRILVSGREGNLVEFTGPELCARSIELARSYCQAPPSGVVLLMLPHSTELFLLHLGLILMGR